MNLIILGNLFSIFAMLSDTFSASRKTAKGVLSVQLFSQVFYGSSSIVLGGYSGAAQNVVSILRNLVAIGNLSHKLIEWFLILLGVVLGFLFNNMGILGWLPTIANLEYSLAVFRFKDNERALKYAFLVNVAMFAVFNAVILNFVAVISNIIVIVLTILFLIRSRNTPTPR